MHAGRRVEPALRPAGAANNNRGRRGRMKRIVPLHPIARDRAPQAAKRQTFRGLT